MYVCIYICIYIYRHTHTHAHENKCLCNIKGTAVVGSSGSEKRIAIIITLLSLYHSTTPSESRNCKTTSVAVSARQNANVTCSRRILLGFPSPQILAQTTPKLSETEGQQGKKKEETKESKEIGRQNRGFGIKARKVEPQTPLNCPARRFLIERVRVCHLHTFGLLPSCFVF